MKLIKYVGLSGLLLLGGCVTTRTCNARVDSAVQSQAANDSYDQQVTVIELQQLCDRNMTLMEMSWAIKYCSEKKADHLTLPKGCDKVLKIAQELKGKKEEKHHQMVLPKPDYESGKH